MSNPPSAKVVGRRGARRLRTLALVSTADWTVPALARNAYRIGRGTVLEGEIPGVLLPPRKSLLLEDANCKIGRLPDGDTTAWSIPSSPPPLHEAGARFVVFALR